MKPYVLGRITASLAVILATTLGAPSDQTHAAAATSPRARTVAPAENATDVVLAFGDTLEELHDAVAYDAPDRDKARIERACGAVIAQYPALRAAVGTKGFDLLVAAESMVDACQRGFAASLDESSFEIVDGDYYTYRELSFSFGDN